MIVTAGRQIAITAGIDIAGIDTVRYPIRGREGCQMTAKEYLSTYKKAKLKIKRYNDKIEELRTLAGSCTVDPTQEKVQSSKKPDPIGDAVAKIADLQAEQRKEYNEAAEILIDITERISSLPDIEYEVIYCRYIKCMQWADIADKLCYSPRYMLHIHKQALKRLEKSMCE